MFISQACLLKVCAGVSGAVTCGEEPQIEWNDNDGLVHTPSIAFRHLPPKEGCRKPVLLAGFGSGAPCHRCKN